MPHAKSLQPFVEHMGADELILSDHYTINESTNVFSASELVLFSATACDLRPIGRADTFAVSGLTRSGHRALVENRVTGMAWKVGVG